MKEVIKIIFYLAIGIGGCILLGGCGWGSSIYAMNRSTDHFLQYPSDPRVLYEPGAEQMAKTAASALPQAIHQVEYSQYRQFVIPVKIYICASIESFKKYGANERAGGLTINKRLFISPKPENTPERIPRILTHELSHLHLSQQLGLFKSISIPFWFSEGLAVYVSGGAGAENVNEEQARESIIQGKHFLPETGSFFSRKTPSSYKLDQHMFYRQASMFITYLKKIDESKFKVFLLAIEDGKDFSTAFEEGYGKGIDTVWPQFIADQKSRR